MNIDTGKIGSLAFILGTAVSFLTPFIALDPIIVKALLVILGAVVGLLNVNDKDTTHFLVAAITIIAAGNVNAGSLPYIGLLIQQILGNIGVFVAPAAVIVAIKAIYTIASGD
ncbi:MAG: hypothetical protein V1836_01585 [Candidatus Aenigmatarchaeota archaeon]